MIQTVEYPTVRFGTLETVDGAKVMMRDGFRVLQHANPQRNKLQERLLADDEEIVVAVRQWGGRVARIYIGDQEYSERPGLWFHTDAEAIASMIGEGVACRVVTLDDATGIIREWITGEKQHA
jgi:hypothetical protein